MENRRKTIVINKKFQHHYALLFVACTIVLVNLLIIIRAFYPGTEPFHFTMGMALVIAIFELALLAGVWYATIRITHHIAGPVYVFTRDISRFANGEHSVRIKLRKGDMFQEEALDLNKSLEALERKLEELQSVRS